MRTILVVENESISWDGQVIRFRAKGRIDDDGTGPSHGDRYHQSDTSLHHFGRALNADEDHYIVLPPQVIHSVVPVVLGCQAYVTYRGKREAAVVGDVGPHSRLGEISVALAQSLSIDPNPNSGGVDSDDLFYEVYPGVPAVVGNKTYSLQHS